MPFTTEEFLSVFESYNTAVFPLQIVFNLLALAAIFLVIKTNDLSSKLISGILSFLWLWIGIVYHIIYFTSINKAAYLFGAVYIIQAVIFFYAGVIKDRFDFKLKKNWIEIVGWIFIAYALIIYPVLGFNFGHGYPKQPTFGLPCPTTIFTFGILLFNTGYIKWYYVLIPLLWSLLGVSAALQLGIFEDLGLLVAGVLGFILILLLNRKSDESKFMKVT